MDTKHIHIADYNYQLSDDRIAKFPLEQRDHSKLLLYRQGQISEDIFHNIAHYLPEKSLMVCNNTRVIQARMHFRKATGALIEVFLMEPALPADYEQMFQTNSQCEWYCMVGNLKKWKEGDLTRTFHIRNHAVMLTATMYRQADSQPAGGTNHRIRFTWDNPHINFADILEQVGELPIPPYLNRETQESDKRTYQTVYSKIKGSVAAPTAGLHFTPEVLQTVRDRGITIDELTLHVGAGTFKPVKSEEIAGHAMHTEYIVVQRHTFEQLLAHQCAATAVGTTSVRTLESLYYIGVKLQSNPDMSEEQLHVNQWEPYEVAHDEYGMALVDGQAVTPEQAIRNILQWLDRDGIDTLHSSTQIIIAPGYTYKIVKRLITNFHQPQSTLLLLVSAFLKGDWKRVYDYALAHNFRFLSYGDSSLLMP